ncbi:alpha/beta hydrolase [Enterococcus sp. LJL120]
MKILTDVIYDEKNQLKMDIYQPEKSNGAALIDIHGGGWFQGDKAKDQDWAQIWAAKGYLVLVPNYRLAPEFLYPTALDDVKNVYHWLKKSDYLEKDKIGVYGSSAGGNLAIELSLAFGLPAVSLSGIIQIEDWLATHQDVTPQPKAAQVNNPNLASNLIDQDGGDDRFYKWFVLNYAGNQTEKIKAMSPLNRVSATAGPMFIANSLNELVPNEGVWLLEAALAEVGVPVMTKFITGSAHAKGYLTEAQPYAELFFKQYLLKD